MEKQISVFIGRTIFSLVKNYRISILIISRFFSLVKKIVLSFGSQHGRHVAEDAKVFWFRCQKELEEFIFRVKT